MVYSPKDFARLIGMPGFSQQLLENHFKLYQGYVTNTNKLIDLLQAMDPTTPMYAELKRRFGWEFNGMRLHELYFDNMSSDRREPDANMLVVKQIEQDFGSIEAWQKEFTSTAAMRGIGWAIVYYDFVAKRLFNTWINEHDVGHLAGGIPVLVLDVFEHAYMLDYGINRADYIQSFFNVLDWGAVDARFIP